MRGIDVEVLNGNGVSARSRNALELDLAYLSTGRPDGHAWPARASRKRRTPLAGRLIRPRTAPERRVAVHGNASSTTVAPGGATSPALLRRVERSATVRGVGFGPQGAEED